MPAETEYSTSFDRSPMPKSLDKARSDVLALPGIDAYLNDPLFPSEIDGKLDAMVKEVTSQLNAENMTSAIAYRFGWSDSQAQEFFSDPDRQPYQSRIEFSSQYSQRAEQFLAIGRYLRFRYEETKNEELGKTLNEFIDYSRTNLFSPYEQRLNDQLNGINPENRKRGTIQPTGEILTLMGEEIERVAGEEGHDTKDLYRQVLDATEGGYFSTIDTYLAFNGGEPALRHALEAIYTRRMRDPDLTVQKLRLVWAAEVYRLSMEIYLETQYELAGFPNTQTVEARIREFLTDNKLVEETFHHLEREAHSVIEHWDQKKGPMDYDEIASARVRYHNYPDTVSTPEQLAEKWQRVLHDMRGFLPKLAFLTTPRTHIEAPTAAGAETARPWSMSY